MKNRKIWQYTILLVAIGLILSVTPMLGTAQRMQGPEIVWEKDIAIRDAKGMGTYRLVNERVAKGDFFNFSNRVLRKVLGRENVKITENAIGLEDGFHGWIDKNDQSSLIMQNAKNGNLFFSNQMTKFVNQEKVVLPHEKEAQSIALSFLKELEILPSDFTNNAELLHIGGLFAQDLRDGQPGETMQKLITLHYGRKLNGFAVQGPGSKIVMEIGHLGEVITLNKKWNPVRTQLQLRNPELKIREVQPLNPNLKIREPEGQATQDGPTDARFNKLDASKLVLSKFLSADETRSLILKELRSEWTTAEKILIRNIRKVYYDRSGNYVQPAYAVECIVYTPEGEFNYLHHVAALRTPPEPIYAQLYTERPKIMDEKQTAIPGEAIGD